MTVQEAIEKEISECKRRIFRIKDFMKNNKDENIDECKENIFVLETTIQALEEIEQYRELGTVEELKEAREKQVASKWIECPYADLIMCPSCNAEFSTIDNCTEQFEYCPKCGKRLG